MTGIRINSLAKSFGLLPVFKNLSLSIPEGEITALLGPSGCGKTTLLNIISGTLAPDAGTIHGTEGRKISYLFQEPRLLPWMTVAGNIDFVLRGHMEKDRSEERSRRFLELVGLLGKESLFPAQLSGGMKQRAALARAYSFPSDILLMDEPFQALDLNLRLSLLRAFVPLWAEEPRTSVFVTHDIQEAILLGHHIIVLSSMPAEIKKIIPCKIPLNERSLASPEMQRIEKEIYTLITEPDGPDRFNKSAPAGIP